ncbi:MAG: assimilatory sulfite reductase (NADPH) flavoprotein subunit [Pseudomonadota bacterium]|nr:assimilatory sulfite reductase (NADPH) flavoprotein subunit [Pseudomonadota bacterium]
MNIRLDNAPLTDEQLAQLNNLLQGLESWQVEWLSGYLSGFRAAQEAMQGQAVSVPDAQQPGSVALTILYGSQTGNTEDVANLLAEKALANGIEAKVLDMAEYKPKQLKNEEYLAILSSTHGEGDPPDNALDLYEFLHSRKAPELKQLQYSVLSLGDSSYEFFCQTGKDFDARLSALGATAVVPRVDCDVDYDEAADAWINELIEALSATAAIGNTPTFNLPAQTAAKTAYDRKNPFPAEVLEKQVLSGRGSSKEVLHLELSLDGSGLQYQPGDALGVYAQNDPALVAAVIETLGFDPETLIDNDTEQQKLSELLLYQREITVLTRPMLEQWAELAGSDALNSLVADKAALNEWLQGRDVLDLIQAYPIKNLDETTFVNLLRKLPPRMYSIASSQAAVEDEVHITVAAVRYSAHERERSGVASTWLADRLTEDSKVPVYIDSNKNFKLPDDDNTPIIMIGPGTGVAPFRSFMQEREERDAKGRNWLFFGDQHFLSDFLYQVEWLAWRKSGLLTRLDVAFSRDQAEKIYVQHRLRQNAIDIWNWLQEGAHIYVCGDADNMAPDVNEALLDIISQQGGKTRDEASDYLRQLTRDKRYQRDVY